MRNANKTLICYYDKNGVGGVGFGVWGVVGGGVYKT